jgi:hypothetical protein
MFAVMLRWQSITPLESPVVPEVYMRTAKSSGSGWASTKDVSLGRTSQRETAPSALLQRHDIEETRHIFFEGQKLGIAFRRAKKHGSLGFQKEPTDFGSLKPGIEGHGHRPQPLDGDEGYSPTQRGFGHNGYPIALPHAAAVKPAREPSGEIPKFPIGGFLDGEASFPGKGKP